MSSKSYHFEREINLQHPVDLSFSIFFISTNLHSIYLGNSTCILRAQVICSMDPRCESESTFLFFIDVLKIGQKMERLSPDL